MLRRISFIVLGLLLAGLLMAGWYAYNKGFTQKWRKFVVQEFHKRGVELSLSKLTLEPFRGIVAKQVRIYDSRDRRRVIAVVDEVRLVVNYANLFQGRTFIDALDLRDANLDVPLDPAKRNGPKIEIRHLSGLLLLPPKQIYLSRLEAELYGMQISASGSLINPQTLPLFSKDKNEASARAALAENVIAQLKQLKYEGTPPQIVIRFRGDLEKPDELFIEAALWAENVRRDNYRVTNLYVNASFRDGIARLRQLTANDSGGAVRASGSYDVENREGSLQLHSGLDAQALVRNFARIPELEEAVFYTPPEIDLTWRGRFSGGWSFQTTGQVNFKKFAYKSVIFDGFTADVSWDGERWSALEVTLMHRTGAITGDFLDAVGMKRSSLKSTIQPKVLAPLFTGKAAEWIPRIEFVESANASESERRIADGLTR